MCAVQSLTQRRRLMKRGFAGLGFALFVGLAASASPVSVPAAGADPLRLNPVAAENALPGTTAWNITPSNFRQVEGYVTEISVAPGETLHFHVQTTPPGRYRIEIYRLGWYGGAGGRLLACLPTCTSDKAGVAQPVPPFDPVTGLLDAGWPVTDTITVPDSWVSGYYLADLVLTSRPGERVGSRVPFVVRAPAGEKSQILIQVPVNTWEAYNAWGGRSLYIPDQSGINNNHVSFERPFDQTPFARGSQMQWELPLIHFLERGGYDVSYQADSDTDADPGTLLEHRLVIVAGHSEYWTKDMRDGFERARDLGTNLAFLGADQSYWQIDYADANRNVLVEYRNPALDPEPDPSLKTTRFRKLVPPWPECSLLGNQFADRPGPWGDGASIGSEFDFTVTAAATADPWFAGTGFMPGDTLHHLVGGEWNAIVPGCQTSQLTVLFHYQGQPGERGRRSLHSTFRRACLQCRFAAIRRGARRQPLLSRSRPTSKIRVSNGSCKTPSPTSVVLHPRSRSPCKEAQSIASLFFTTRILA